MVGRISTQHGAYPAMGLETAHSMASRESNPPVDAQQIDVYSLNLSLLWTGSGEQTAEHLLLLCPKVGNRMPAIFQ